MARQAKWQRDLAAGRVTAYLQDGKVQVTTTQTIEVPITGTPEGELYGGERSGWFTVAGSTPVTQPAAPAQGSGPAVGPGAAPGGAAQQPGVAVRGTAASRLKIDRLRITPRRFAASRSARAARKVRKAARRAPDGATITWLLNRRATVRLSVTKVVTGRRVGGRCVTATSKAKRRGATCTRTVAVGTLKRSAIAGENAVRLTGRIGRRTLTPGRYRVTVRATGADGRTAAPKSLTFTVVNG
jgi:hypothetical protein